MINRTAVIARRAWTDQSNARWRRAAELVLACLIAFAVTGLLMVALGISPIDAYVGIIAGAFGSTANLSDTIVKTVPIALIALGVSLTFRCGLWNAGGEGQLYFGAAGAVIAGINLNGPPLPTVLAEVTVGVTFGAIAGLAPAILKLRFGANEILVTLMLNFIGILFAEYLISGPYASGSTSATRPISVSAELPWFQVLGLRLHLGMAFLIVAAVVMYALMHASAFGFKVWMIGSNRQAARSAGVAVGWISTLSFVIAGGLAGLAGTIQVAAVHYSLPESFSPGFGFSAIIASLLGRLNVLGTVIASFALAALFVGAQAMQRTQGIPSSLVLIVEGALLVSLLAFRVVAFGLFRSES